MNSVVSMQNVFKRYRTVQALDNVSFEIPAGTVCALLGANGAGKSTSIRSLLGLEEPDSGECYVLGKNSQKFSQEIRQQIGYVPEKPALYEWMTLREIGWFAAGFHPIGYETKFLELVKRFGLNLDQKISQLSKGTKAKVSLSLAMAHQPPLLILDEPTSGLDPLIRREFLESMVDIAAENRTVLLCSHQVSEVERVADMVIILINGKLICCENLDDLKSRTLEAIVTMPDGGNVPFVLPGKVLSQTRYGNEQSVLLQDVNAEQLRDLEQKWQNIRIRKPGLEDILLSLLKESRDPRLPETSAKA